MTKCYPGVKPFERADKNLFFGRDQDREQLSDLILLEKLVVFFGKSGYGKSSLMNAGVLPELSAEVQTVLIRFGSYMHGQSQMPLQLLQQRLDETGTNRSEMAFLETLGLAKTLWLQTKQKLVRSTGRRAKIPCFVLIFDQFEEFFTYPVSQQALFKEQLAELLYTDLPQNAREIAESLPQHQQFLLADRFDAKCVFVIRSDRMSLLDSMKDKLPAILFCRYELKGLSPAQAQQAIVEPARVLGDFVSPPFEYSPAALQVMTQKWMASKPHTQSGIEAFQLQILCEYLENKVIQGEIPTLRVEPTDFQAEISEIYEGYYQRLLDKLNPQLRHAAQRLIEEELIFHDPKTHESRRESRDSGRLLLREGVTKALLDELESHFLLRREPNSMGGMSYEVSHDTLLEPMLRHKNQRIASENAAAEAALAQRKRRKLMAIVAGTLLIFALSLSIVYYLYRQNQENQAILKSKATQELQDLERRIKVILRSGANRPDIFMIRERDSLSKKYNLPLEDSIDIQLKFKF